MRVSAPTVAVTSWQVWLTSLQPAAVRSPAVRAASARENGPVGLLPGANGLGGGTRPVSAGPKNHGFWSGVCQQAKVNRSPWCMWSRTVATAASSARRDASRTSGTEMSAPVTVPSGPTTAAAASVAVPPRCRCRPPGGRVSASPAQEASLSPRSSVALGAATPMSSTCHSNADVRSSCPQPRPGTPPLRHNLGRPRAVEMTTHDLAL